MSFFFREGNPARKSREDVMKLYIDTSNSEKIEIGIGNKRFTASSKKQKAQMLLPFVVEKLESEKKEFTDIKEIEINPGPGSFTGLRVGLSVANAISYALKVPVNGKKVWVGEKVELKYE